MDLERLAVLRAQEQMEGDGWRRRDPDEPAVVPEVRRCPVCDAVIPRKGRRQGMTGRICHDCSVKGWRPSPCVSCGGPTRCGDKSRHLKASGLFGVCGKCRAQIRLNMSDAEEAA